MVVMFLYDPVEKSVFCWQKNDFCGTVKKPVFPTQWQNLANPD